MVDRLAMIEAALDAVMPKAAERPSVLSSAMRWAVEGGGKRIRPQICLAAAESVGGRAEDALMPACAIELLHSYTLVHDDLPSMDNDVERRGKASVWAKFGEANAILAGDALQALAFEVAARSPRNAAAIVAELAHRGVGVVRGQVEDIHASSLKVSKASRAPNDLGAFDADFVYEHKTADLFMAAAVMGGLAGGGSEDDVARLRDYAHHLGIAFQYEDDLLDGDSPCGPVEAARRARAVTEAAVAALVGLPGDTTFLASLARGLIGRSR